MVENVKNKEELVHNTAQRCVFEQVIMGARENYVYYNVRKLKHKKIYSTTLQYFHREKAANKEQREIMATILEIAEKFNIFYLMHYHHYFDQNTYFKIMDDSFDAFINKKLQLTMNLQYITVHNIIVNLYN